MTKNRVEGFEVVGPYIEVETDAPVAHVPITLSLPATVEDGAFAMGFFYDPDRGRFEGIPTYPNADDTARVLVVRHFTGAVLGKANEATFSRVAVPTPFARGQDDFAFENAGTYAAPFGMCGGWSIAALHAWRTRRIDGKHLMDLVDDSARPGFATPEFGLDDVRAIQLTTAIQQGVSFASENAQLFESLHQDANPSLAFELLAFSLWLTREPQFHR